jgi:hypothetical protein
MSIELDALRSLWVREESSYQTDHSGTFPSDFLAVPYKEGTLSPKGVQTLLDPLAAKLRADGHSLKVLGKKECTLGFGITLHSHGLDLDGDVAPPTTANWALMRILVALMGGSATTTSPGAQTTVQSGTTTTTVNVTAGHGARFAANGVIACQTVSGSSALELREILSVSTDAVTVKEAFSATPVTGTPVRGGITISLTEDPAQSLQFITEGRESSDRAGYRGMAGGFKLDLKVGELAALMFDLKGAGWGRLSDASPQSLSYSHFSPIAMVASELHVPTVGSTTRAAVDYSALSIEPSLVYEPQRAGGAAETIKRMKRQATRPFVKGSFVTPYEDQTWYTARDNREVRALFAQIGSLAGSACLISCPTIQVTDVQPAPADVAISGLSVSFEGRHDESAAAGSSAHSYSAQRYHFV